LIYISGLNSCEHIKNPTRQQSKYIFSTLDVVYRELKAVGMSTYFS
jgi:hypothetical protein